MTPQEAKKCFLWNMMEDLNLSTLEEFSQMKLTGVGKSSCLCGSWSDLRESFPLLSYTECLSNSVCVEHWARYFIHHAN